MGGLTVDTTFSPAVATAFNAWRDAWLAQCYHDQTEPETNDETLRLNDLVSDGAQALFRVQCTAPGDFIVKAYVNLLWCAGHTNTREVLLNGTIGSFFDVNLSEIDSDSLLTDDYYRSVYADLDGNDVGRCLLAFGLPAFSANDFVEAADRADVYVDVIVGIEGDRRLSIVGNANGECAVERQQLRLRLISSEKGSGRTRLLGEHIVKHRPHRVLHVPAALDRGPA